MLGRVARHDRGRGIVESLRPVEPAVGSAPVDAPEVVHDVAARHDQDAALAQRRELRAELEVVVERLRRVDRQLHDRDVGVGNVCTSTDQVPWSMPQLSASSPTHVGCDQIGDLGGELRIAGRRVLAPRTARRGSRRSRGWSSACAIAVTAEALMYQCADTTRMARGRGTSAPNARHASVYRLWSSAFIGVP